MDVKKEQLLIVKAQKGDQEAFTELFHAHYSFVYKYIIKMTFDPYVAEEILQETMLKCYLHISTFNGSSKFTSWIMTVATRTYVDYLRKKKRERWLFKKAADQKYFTIQWNIQQNGKEYADLLEEMLNLDPLFRIPIVLKHYYGFSYEEIGEMLNVKTGTVKSRVHKGMKLIRKELSDGET